MFKSKEFKELIGFNHTWLVIVLIIVTGLGFPFIFFNDTWGTYSKNLWSNILIGLFYASIMVWGNLYIFYKLHPKIEEGASFETFQNQKAHFIKATFYHLTFTIIASFVLALIPKSLYAENLTRYYILRNSVGTLLLCGIVVAFYEVAFYMKALGVSMKKQEELKRKNVESQLEILKNQVKPHFLFNSLNTLSSLIPEEPGLAVDYVQKLSKVYRYILEIKDQKLIPLEEELDCIKAYLFLLKIRFGENLQFEIATEGLNLQEHIIPLSLQLLIENSVKHNVISKKKPLLIQIKKGSKNTLVISNNFQPKLNVESSTGTGLENIRRRYEILTQKKVKVLKSEEEFIVEIPLVEVAF